MLADKLTKLVGGAGWAGLDRLIRQVPLDVEGQGISSFVPPCAIFFQRFHDDPIEVASQ